MKIDSVALRAESAPTVGARTASPGETIKGLSLDRLRAQTGRAAVGHMWSRRMRVTRAG
jgi:hypothetical protein